MAEAAPHTPFDPELPGAPESLWISTAPSTAYPPLPGNIETDVAILGGGIAGIVAAHDLHKAGVRVAVIEAGQLLRGVTGHTTAKLTSAHSLIYAYLVEKFGLENARLYAEANQQAIDRVERDVERLDMPDGAHFRRMPAHTFLQDKSRIEELRKEVDAAQRCGLRASFVDDLDIPVEIAGAVRIMDQAIFHPLLYLQALAREIADPKQSGPAASASGQIFEHTRATEVKEPKNDRDPVEVLTPQGAVRAQRVIVATHQPFMYDGLYFARVTPKRSYVIHLEFPEPLPEPLAGAHYYGPETPYTSLRPTADRRGLLLGGQNHKTGELDHTEECYLNLEKRAREMFGDGPTIRHRWSTQDNVSVDKVPFIGPLTPLTHRVFVATGFGGWGMSNGIAAGEILAELVQDRPHPWAPVFDPARIKPDASAKEFMKHNLEAAMHLVGDRLVNLTKSDMRDLYPGQARVMTAGMEKIAVYRDPEGEVHACSATCTHMGCVVHWNRAERSWDCPCHGSRFSPDGEVLQSPAVKPLAKREVKYS